MIVIKYTPSADIRIPFEIWFGYDLVLATTLTFSFCILRSNLKKNYPEEYN